MTTVAVFDPISYVFLRPKEEHMVTQREENETQDSYAKSSYVIRTYKDTVFRMLFADKKELLALYNAVNDTDYADPEELLITTLDSAVFMSIKNDVSFVIDMRLSLYEQQSTVNPNMPLRDLLYVSQVYEQMVVRKDLYSRKKIALPPPHFLTFYNGVEEQPERKEFRLSDSYYGDVGEPSLELIVMQLNINPGYNEALKKKCPTLYQYMLFVERIRRYAKESPLQEAVERAIDECIEEGILAEFLRREKVKGINMSILYEFDQELHDKTLYQDGVDEGFEQGIEQGIERGRDLTLITQVLRKLKKSELPEMIAEELEEERTKVIRICDAIRECEKFEVEPSAEHVLERLNAEHGEGINQ